MTLRNAAALAPASKEYGISAPASGQFVAETRNMKAQTRWPLDRARDQNYIRLDEYMATSVTAVDEMFRAFSDPTRLRILNLLRPGELCVCDLVRVIGAPQPTISRHLAYLRSAQLVVARKDGLWMHYRLCAPKSSFHRKLLECLACCLADVPELARDARRLAEGKNSCCD